MILYRSRGLNLRKTPMKMYLESKQVDNKPIDNKLVIATTIAGQTVNG